MISLLWAMDENRVIGKNNDLPWRLPADLKYFKQVTMGHPVAMGRKTFDSIGRKLPGRENIIITRNLNYEQEGCTVLHTIEELVDYSKKFHELFVIGGADIFDQCLPFADRLYITYIYHSFEGDTYFPPFDMEDWIEISRVKGDKNEQNPYNYDFVVYERKQ